MNLLGQKITLRRILGMIAGVVIIGIGIAVFKFSRLGNDSISALNLRLAELVGLPFSIENVLMNLCLFVPQLLWGRRRLWRCRHAAGAAALGRCGGVGHRAGVLAVPDGGFRRRAV